MNKEQENHFSSEKKTIDLSIKLLLILILVAWSIMIIFPFVTPMLWGIILAITLFPMYRSLVKLFKGKKTVASILITLLLLCVLLIPTGFLISSVVNEAKELRTALNNKTLVIPPPNAKVAQWPLVGKKIYDAWSTLNSNLEAGITKYHQQIVNAGQKVVVFFLIS
jgi:predicted PurR-regulated permease PerM